MILRRDIVIEVVSILVLILTLIVCTIYTAHRQELHALETHTILTRTYNLLNEDLQERRNHRQTIDARLNDLQQKLGEQLTQMTSQQQLLDELAARLRIETKNRKNGKGTNGPSQ